MDETKFCYVRREECNDKNQIFMDEIKEVKTEIKNLSVDLAALPEKLIEKMDEKYATKKTENIVYGIVVFIGLTLFSIIGYLIDKYIL